MANTGPTEKSFRNSNYSFYQTLLSEQQVTSKTVRDTFAVCLLMALLSSPSRVDIFSVPRGVGVAYGVLKTYSLADWSTVVYSYGFNAFSLPIGYGVVISRLSLVQ